MQKPILSLSLSLQQIKQFILGFVSPIALHHGVNLLGAVAVVWNDRRQRSSGGNKKVS